jgi:WD40 repeat protein
MNSYTKLRFSRSGKLLFAQKANVGVFFIWRMDKGGARQPLEISYGTGDNNSPTVKFADVSGDEWLVTIIDAEETSPVNLWNLRTGSKKPLTLSPLSTSIDVAKARQSDEHLLRQLLIAQASLDPKGERLITTNMDNEVHVWDLRNVNEKSRPIVLPCDSYATSIGFLEDRLYVGTLAGPILEWTLSSSNPLKTRRAFNGHELIVSKLATVPGTGLMISAAIEGADVYNAPEIDRPEIRIWRPLENGTGMIPIRLRGHTARPYGAMFSSDGRWLLTVGVTGFIRFDNRAVLWDFSNPYRPRAARVIDEHKTGVIVSAIGNNRAFTVGGVRDLFESTYESDVFMWALSNPKAAPVVLKHSAAVEFLSPSSNDNWLVTYSDGEEAWLWDLRKAEPRSVSRDELGGIATSIAIAPGEKHACVGFADGMVRIFDITGDHPRQVGGGREHSDPVTSVEFITEGELISGAGDDLVLRYWKVGELKSVGQVDLGAIGLERPSVRMNLSKHGRWLIIEAESQGKGKRYLYDLQTRPSRLVDLSEYHGDVLFSADDRWLAIVNEDSTVVFDLFGSGRNPTKISEGGFDVDKLNHPAILTSGSHLLITYLKQMTRIRDLNKIVRNSFESLALPGEAMLAATSPDGRYLVTVWEDFSIWPLDFEDLKRRAEQAAGRDLTPNERTLYGLAPAQNN